MDSTEHLPQDRQDYSVTHNGTPKRSSINSLGNIASGLISVLFERVDLVLEAEAASATTVLFFEVLGSLAGGAGVALAVVPPGEGTCCVEG